jgi:hypothetical protein
MTKPVTFVCRINGFGGFCDIAGSPVDRPTVYQVPARWYAESIAGKLAPGITTHSFDDWTGPMHAVIASGHGEAYRLTTGNPLNK